MNRQEIYSLNQKVKNHYGEDYSVIATITGNEQFLHWEMAEQRLRMPRKVDKLRYQNQQTKKMDNLEVDETRKIIALKHRDSIYYASDYPARTLAIKNSLNGKIMLVSRSFKFVNKRNSTNSNKTKEKGMIRNV